MKKVYKLKGWVKVAIRFISFLIAFVIYANLGGSTSNWEIVGWGAIGFIFIVNLICDGEAYD